MHLHMRRSSHGGPGLPVQVSWFPGFFPGVLGLLQVATDVPAGKPPLIELSQVAAHAHACAVLLQAPCGRLPPHLPGSHSKSAALGPPNDTPFPVRPPLPPNSQVLRQYKPATFLSAQQAARAAAAAAGGEQQAPLRTLRLDKLLGEVQVGCCYFVDAFL